MRQGCTVDSNWLIAYTNHMYILSLRKILGKTDCKGLFLFISSVQLLHQTAEPRVQLRIWGDGAQYHQVSKLVRVGNSIIGFLIKSIDFVIKRLIPSRSIFFKDWRDRFYHGRSFAKIDGINTIMVDLFQRLTRAKRFRWYLKKMEEQRLTGAIRSLGIKRGKNIQKICVF